MKELNEQKVALTFGLFMGGFHLAWALLIALGFAQPLLNFVFMLHMIVNPFRVVEFNIAIAAFLVVMTFLVGYAGGWIFAWVWNRVHK